MSDITVNIQLYTTVHNCTRIQVPPTHIHAHRISDFFDFFDFFDFQTLRLSDLEGEGASINEVAIEHIGILFGGKAPDLKYIEEVIKLPMCVATDSDVVVFRDLNMSETGQRLEMLPKGNQHLIQKPEQQATCQMLNAKWFRGRTLLVNELLVFEPGHHLNYCLSGRRIRYHRSFVGCIDRCEAGAYHDYTTRACIDTHVSRV